MIVPFNENVYNILNLMVMIMPWWKMEKKKDLPLLINFLQNAFFPFDHLYNKTIKIILVYSIFLLR